MSNIEADRLDAAADTLIEPLEYIRALETTDFLLDKLRTPREF